MDKNLNSQCDAKNIFQCFLLKAFALLNTIMGFVTDASLVEGNFVIEPSRVKETCDEGKVEMETCTRDISLEQTQLFYKFKQHPPNTFFFQPSDCMHNM